MCDYCDCRSHPAIAALSADHEVLLGRLAELERAVDVGDRLSASSVSSELHELLHAHAASEERGVFTELREALGADSYVGTFEDDHRLLHELSGAVEGAEWMVAARALIEGLRAHIDREETDLFPAAHQMLAPSQWAAMDAALLVT